MKLLLAFTLTSLVTGMYDMEDMTENWVQMKALESCWGEETMKQYVVSIKKAVAKCSHEDAPELNLPPYRSTYRFVNTIMNGADDMNNRQTNMMWRLMQSMMNQQSNNRNQYRESNNNYGSSDNEMMMKFFMKMMMMRNMMDNQKDKYDAIPNDQNVDFDMVEAFRTMFDNSKGNFRTNRPDSNNANNNMMSQFYDMFSNSRSKRQTANPDLDIGDRLVEKLNEQKHIMESKVGNMTCVLKEMGTLNHNNELDLRTIKEDVSLYTMPSAWFGERFNQILDTCYEMATNLPANINNNAVVSGDTFGTINLAQVKSFKKCCYKAEIKLCMNQDIKNKVEANFGPLEEILEQTQLTEYELFPLVIQLLQGKEMEYMMADF